MIASARRLKWRFSFLTDEAISHLAQKVEIASFVALNAMASQPSRNQVTVII
jgi:hypothetical protein